MRISYPIHAFLHRFQSISRSSISPAQENSDHDLRATVGIMDGTPRRLSIALVSVVALCVACASSQQPETQAPEATAVPTTSTAPATSSTSTTSTTVPEALLDVSDLPRVLAATSFPENVSVLQRLLNVLCCERAVDGDFGPKTQESLFEARSMLGLGEGWLDAEMWSAVFELDVPRPDFVESDLFFDLPSTAVLFEENLGGDRRYTLAGSHSFTEVSTPLLTRYSQKAWDGWEWCGTERTQHSVALQWLTESPIEKYFELSVEDRGGGRIDIIFSNLSEVDWACATDVPTTTRPRSTTTRPRPPTTTSPPRRATTSVVPALSPEEVTNRLLRDLKTVLAARYPERFSGIVETFTLFLRDCMAGIESIMPGAASIAVSTVCEGWFWETRPNVARDWCQAVPDSTACLWAN